MGKKGRNKEHNQKGKRRVKGEECGKERNE